MCVEKPNVANLSLLATFGRATNSSLVAIALGVRAGHDSLRVDERSSGGGDRTRDTRLMKTAAILVASAYFPGTFCLSSVPPKAFVSPEFVEFVLVCPPMWAEKGTSV